MVLRSNLFSTRKCIFGKTMNIFVITCMILIQPLFSVVPDCLQFAAWSCLVLYALNRAMNNLLYALCVYQIIRILGYFRHLYDILRARHYNLDDYLDLIYMPQNQHYYRLELKDGHLRHHKHPVVPYFHLSKCTAEFNHHKPIYHVMKIDNEQHAIDHASITLHDVKDWVICQTPETSVKRATLEITEYNKDYVWDVTDIVNALQFTGSEDALKDENAYIEMITWIACKAHTSVNYKHVLYKKTLTIDGVVRIEQTP